MSCDRLAAHAIATLGIDLTPEARARLQAVYDLPPALQPGEDGPALRRAAQALVLRLKATGADIPEHLKLDSPRSRAAIRFGRLALALANNWGGSPVTDSKQAPPGRRARKAPKAIEPTIDPAQAPKKSAPTFQDQYGYCDSDKYEAAVTLWAQHHLTLMERGGPEGNLSYQTVVRELEANSSAVWAISLDLVTSFTREIQNRSGWRSRPAFYGDLIDRVATRWTGGWFDRPESERREAWDMWAAGGDVCFDSPDLRDSDRRDLIERAIEGSFE